MAKTHRIVIPDWAPETDITIGLALALLNYPNYPIMSLHSREFFVPEQDYVMMLLRYPELQWFGSECV